jgi:hypothetical protein
MWCSLLRGTSDGLAVAGVRRENGPFKLRRQIHSAFVVLAQGSSKSFVWLARSSIDWSVTLRAGDKRTCLIPAASWAVRSLQANTIGF